MKKLILLVCFLLVSSQSFSLNLFTENFSYTAGTLLTANGWTAISGAGANAPTASPPGLTFTDFFGDPYVGSGVGNKTILNSSGEDDARNLTSTQTSGTLYASFMLNIAPPPATGDYFFALRSIANAHNGRVYIRSDGSGFNLGIGNAGSGVVPVYDASIYTSGTPLLVILQYQFVPGAGNDLLSLYIFEQGDIVPPTPPTPNIGPLTLAGQTDAVDINSVLLRQGSAGSAATLAIDGIYVEDTWNNTVLPVELSSFTSVINKRDVTLNWTTSTESNNSGFDIERSSANSSWSKVGNVAGNGTVNSAVNYSFTDRGLATGNYNYRLKQIDFNGNFEYFNLSNEINIGIPSRYELSQNYPNPFNPSTNVEFGISELGFVSLKIYDASGKEVAALVNETRPAGYYSVSFDGSNLTSGIYFYTLEANNFTTTKKMMMLK